MVRAVVEQFLNTGVPGVLAYGIAADGSGARYAARIAEPRTGRRLTPDATFRTASNTKTFAAATALQLRPDHPDFALPAVHGALSPRPS